MHHKLIGREVGHIRINWRELGWDSGPRVVGKVRGESAWCLFERKEWELI